MPRRFLSAFPRVLGRGMLLPLTFLVGLSCTDGSLPLGWEEGERIPTTLLLSPTLAGPALATGVATLPVNRIRLTATHADTDDLLGQAVVDVDPAADGWEVPVNIALLDAGAVPVVVLVEMINVGPDGVERVVFSGRTGVIQARPGGSASVSEVPVYPGSPGNLSITSVEIQGAPDALVEGGSVQLQVEVVGAEGEAEVFWSALDPGVAGITTGGLVEAGLPGVARFEAAAGPRADTVTITVNQRVEGVQVTPGEAVVDALDETVTFQAQAVDPRGDVIPEIVFVWTVENPAVAEHMGDGVLRAVGPGSTEVSAEAAGVVGQGTFQVDPAVRTLSVGVESLRLEALGATATISATPEDRNGFPVAGALVTWTTSDPSVVSVGDGGEVTAQGNGTAVVTGTAGEVQATVQVEVAQVVTEVRLDPVNLLLQAVGATGTFQATPLDANANPVVDAAVIWASSLASVATVSQAGVVTAVAAGSAQITASSGEVAGSGDVIVEQAPASVTVAPASSTLQALGLTTAFSAQVTDANGNVIPGAAVTWTSSNPGVASVAPTGVATAQGNGTSTISASFGGVTGSGTLTVAQAPASVSVSPPAATLDGVGSTVSLSAQVLDSGGSVIPNPTVTWASSAPGVASVGATGVVTAQGDGTAVISASVGGISGSATVSVTVTQVPTTVTLDPTTLNFTYLGETAQLTATVLDAGGSLITEPSIFWESTDIGIAMVDGTGLVTAMGEGPAQITARAGDAIGAAEVLVDVIYTEDPYELNDDLLNAWSIDDVEVAGELNAATGSPGLPFETVWDPGPAGFNPEPVDIGLRQEGMSFLEYVALEGHILGAPFLHQDGDEDYFHFQLASPGIVTMEVENRTPEEGSPGADRTALNILNAITEEERLHWLSAGPGQTGLMRSHLEPGEYAVRVWPDGSQTQPLPYTLQVSPGGATATPDYLNGDMGTSLEPNDFSTFAGAQGDVGSTLPFNVTGNLPDSPGPYFPDVDLFLIPEDEFTVEVLARNPFATSQQVDVRLVVRLASGALAPYGTEGLQLEAGQEGWFTDAIPADGRDYFVEVMAFGGSPYDLCVRWYSVEGSYCYGYGAFFDEDATTLTAAAGSTVSIPMFAGNIAETPYPGARIRVTASDGTLSEEVVLTDEYGGATVDLTLPSTPGLVTVSAALVGMDPDEIEIQVVPAMINWVAGSDQEDTDAANLAVSQDGLTWYEVLGAPIGAVESVAWGGPGAGGSLWVAVGGSRFTFDWEAPIVTSPDGIEWTPRAPILLDYARRVAWGEYDGEPSWLVLGATEGTSTIQKSTDGVGWNPIGTGIPAGPPAGDYVDLAFGDTLWVVINSSGQVATYSLSVGWIGWSNLPNMTYSTGVTFTGSEFVVLGSDSGSGRMARSSDGITWVTENVSPGGDSFINPGRIRWDGMRFLTPFWGNPGEMGVSANGVDWTLQNLPHSDSVMDVAFDPGANRWVSAGTGSFSLATSTDGTTWTGVSSHWAVPIEGRPWATTVAHRSPFYPLGLNRAPAATINQPTPGTYFWSASPDNIPLDGSGSDPEDGAVVDPGAFVWIREDTEAVVFTGPSGTLSANAFPGWSNVTLRLEVTDSQGAVGVDRVNIFVSGC